VNKKVYTEDDLQIRSTAHIEKIDDVYIHTHTVVFDRPLTQAERHMFIAVLNGFYYTVHFSRQFGDGPVAEPTIEFEGAQTARYTLKQATLNGPWKHLLLSILFNFSREVAPIQLHDDSRLSALVRETERTPARHERQTSK